MAEQITDDLLAVGVGAARVRKVRPPHHCGVVDRFDGVFDPRVVDETYLDASTHFVSPQSSANNTLHG